jgi:hypothetical protein
MDASLLFHEQPQISPPSVVFPSSRPGSRWSPSLSSVPAAAVPDTERVLVRADAQEPCQLVQAAVAIKLRP